MTTFPAPESFLPPEGTYSIRLNREPQVNDFPYTKKDGSQHVSKKIILYGEAKNETGTFSVIDSFLPWDGRYADLLAALHVEHSCDIRAEGMSIEAEIVHEPDKKNPSKVYARLTNIRPADDQDIPDFDDDDDEKIPF